MAAIKVLHITDLDVDNYYLNNLCDYTDEKVVDYSFITFAPPSSFVSSLESRGRRVYALDSQQRKKYPKAYSDISKLIKTEKPDIVHTHLFDPSLIGLTAAKRLKRRTVLTRHHSDAIHQLSSLVKRQFYLKLENYINRQSDQIIAPSQMVRDILVKWENVQQEKVSIIPYGQTTERFDAITPEKIEEVQVELNMKESIALVCTSRLFYRKGHKYLFQAFAELVKTGLNATLYLVGPGDYKSFLINFAAELQITDRVKFLDWRDDALTIMAAADIIVHPSLEDALSSAVIESVMLGKPIIATDISGVRDSLGDNQYGKLVPPADAESFRIALTEMLGDLEAARIKARKGRKHLLSYMDSQRTADEHIVVYRKLMPEKTQGRT